MLRLISGTVIGLIGYYILDYILNDALPCPIGIEHLIVICFALGLAVYVITSGFKLGGGGKSDI